MSRTIGNRRSFYYRLLITIFLSSFLIGVGITFLLYGISARNVREEIIRVNKAMLTQTKNQSEIIYEQVTSLGTELLAEDDVMRFMLLAKKDPILEIALMRKLNSIATRYSFVDSIIVYNGQLDRYLNSLRIYNPPDDETVALIKQNSNNPINPTVTHIQPRIHKEYNYFGEVVDTEHKVLTYTVYPSLRQLAPAQYAIVVNVRSDYLMDNIIDSMAQMNGSALIIDQRGTVLVGSELGDFNENLSGWPYIDSVLSAQEPIGSLQADVKGVRSLITYIRSENNEGWTFLNAIPLDQMTPALSKQKNQTLITFLAVFILSTILSIVIAKRLYWPVDRLVKRFSPANLIDADQIRDEFHLLETSILQAEYQKEKVYSQLKQTIQQQFMHVLLTGKDIGDPKYQEMLYQLNSSGSHMVVMVSYQLPEQREEQGDKLLLYAASNVFEELLERIGSCMLEYQEQNTIAFLLSMNDDVGDDAVRSTVKAGQDTLLAYFHLRCHVGVGDAVALPEDVHSSYQHAMKALHYGMFVGSPEPVLWENSAVNRESPFYYPSHLEKKLIDAMRLESVQKVREALALLHDELMVAPYTVASFVPSQIMLAISREFAHVIENNDAYDFHQSFVRLNSQTTLNEIMHQMQDTFSLLIRLAQAQRQSRSEEWIDMTNLHMMEHLHDGMYSVEAAAENACLSTDYFSKRYKSETGRSFHETLLDIRLKRAEELLSDTTLRVVDISEAVGIPNTNYFYLLFRKKYGVTPSEYRRNARASESAKAGQGGQVDGMAVCDDAPHSEG